jgi:hypothetical protein
MSFKPIAGKEAVPTGLPAVGTVGTDSSQLGAGGNGIQVRGNCENVGDKELTQTFPQFPAFPPEPDGSQDGTNRPDESLRQEGNPTPNTLLESKVRDFADELLQLFSGVPKLRTQVMSLIRQSLPGEVGGRPKIDETTHAIDVRRQGKQWPAVYMAVIPGYAQLGPETRQLMTRQLRDRVRNRLYAERKARKNLKNNPA